MFNSLSARLLTQHDRRAIPVCMGGTYLWPHMNRLDTGAGSVLCYGLFAEKDSTYFGLFSEWQRLMDFLSSRAWVRMNV